jgi:hypothetical protein
METEKKSFFNFKIPTFNKSIIYSFLYFILLITLIIIIFSSSYITISLILTLFFLYLFFSQLYKFFISKEKNYLTIILSSFIIGVLFTINLIIPNDNSILENINNPNMNGTIIIIIYSTLIYCLLFILSLIYSTYEENKNLLYVISIAVIILNLIYFVYFNYVSVTSSSFLMNILITIPFISSIMFIIYYTFGDSNALIDNSLLNNTSFKQLLENPNYVTPKKSTDDENYISKFLFVLYLIIFFICFIIFLMNTNKVINKCEISEYILYIVNGLLIIMLLSITINMTTIGLNIPSVQLSQLLTVSVLIIYNIFISKNLNDSCYEIIKNNASTVIAIIYIITFYMYYKIIFNNCKIGEDPVLLVYFVILVILFIIVLFSINNSKLSTETIFNDYINIYIYTIIGYASFFTVGFILLFIKKKFSLENLLSILPSKEKFIENSNITFYIIIGIYILISIISWISELGKSLYTNNSLDASTIIISLCIIIVNMAILFKLISYSSFYQDSPLLQVVIGSFFYIPCMLISVLDYINGYYNNNKQLITNNFESKNFQFNKTDIILLIFIVILYIIYFTYPMIYTKISSQDGKLLLKEPIYLDNEKLLATHEFLSIKDNINPNKENSNKEIHPYNYALSFWIYIDSNNSINSKNKYYSILNYGYNPNIKYRGSDNSFIVTLSNKNKDDQYYLYDDKYELDNENNVIIYKTNKLFLQKWNNIIINYNGSILDIFVNGILEKSFKEIIPYMKNDNITIGSKNGIHSGICNIVYFDSSLTLEKISYIYNSVKMLNPPILLNYYDRLYMSSLQIENVTYDIGLKQVEPNKKLDYVK